MNSQSLIIFALGAFVALLVTVAAIDQYLLDEHPPNEVDGLIWRIENSFSRIRDLEAVIEITRARTPDEPIRMVVRYLSGALPALSVRYLRPEAIRDERFIVQNDQLSHYLPHDDLVVIKRWVGLPLSDIGLGMLDVSGLRDEWSSGRVRIAVVQDVPGFSRDLFKAPLALEISFAPVELAPVRFAASVNDNPCPLSFSICPIPGTADSATPTTGGQIAPLIAITSLGGSYILEVRDGSTEELIRMIWVERDTFLIRKVVVFAEGQRSSTLYVERIELDQGLTEEEITTIPSRGIETIRG